MRHLLLILFAIQPIYAVRVTSQSNDVEHTRQDTEELLYPCCRSILMRFFGGEQKYTDLEKMDLIGHNKCHGDDGVVMSLMGADNVSSNISLPLADTSIQNIRRGQIRQWHCKP